MKISIATERPWKEPVPGTKCNKQHAVLIRQDRVRSKRHSPLKCSRGMSDQGDEKCVIQVFNPFVWTFFRVVSLAVLLASVDAAFISYAFQSTITKGASVQLVFGFEYAILLTIVVNTVVKYILNSIDLHSENPWEGKAVCLLYAELVLGFIKVKVHALLTIQS